MTALRAALAAAQLDWIVPEWPAPPDVHAFSTTRNLGAQGATASPVAPDGLEAAIGPWVPSLPRWLHQVHGAEVHDADVDATVPGLPHADAIVTRKPNIVCAIQTADCLPVLFTDRSGGVIGAAHAGWRGLAAGVLEGTLRAMRADPEQTLVWIGPGIGPHNYEVGADVRDAHCASDPEAQACFVPRAQGRWFADLVALARRRLERAGVRSIYGGNRCTYSEHTVFHSYRRDGGRAGRMVTLLWRTR